MTFYLKFGINTYVILVIGVFIMKVAVMTDSNSGLTQKEGKELGIKVVPMPFMIDGEEYFEDVNLTQEMFYEKLQGDANVSTSQPAIGVIMTMWDELLEEYDQIIYIPMSSGLSKSCESALRLAESDYKGKVFVVDNKRISVTQKASVFQALELVKEGLPAEEIHEKLLETSMNASIYIMLDTLKHLKKGGRITPAAAAVGGILKIKPVLKIAGDKLDKFRMMNRTIPNARRILIDAVKEDINGFLKDIDGRTDNVEIQAAFTGVDRTEVNTLVKEAEAELGLKVSYVDPLSLSVSCHIGDGAIALTVVKK